MIPIKHHFRSKAGDKYNIYFLSDIHLGNPAFLKDEFERVCDIINNDKDAYTLFLGDLTDDDRPSTRIMRQSMFTDRKEAFEQEDLQHLGYIDRVVIPQMSKLAKNCLGMLDGDHYRRYSNGLSSVQYICAKLKVSYLGDGMARVKLDFLGPGRKSNSYNIHIQHGVAGIGRPGNGVNRLDDVARQWEGMDCFVRGHNHVGFIYPISRYYEKQSGKIGQKDIWLINTPSFRTGIMDGTTDYTERRAYGATAHKFPILHLKLCKPRSNNSNLFISATSELV